MEQTWEEIAGKNYDKNMERYINSFDFKGGGGYGINGKGLYSISYIYRVPKIKIKIANIKLFFMWLIKNIKKERSIYYVRSSSITRNVNDCFKLP